jgi:hypothetical protein
VVTPSSQTSSIFDAYVLKISSGGAVVFTTVLKNSIATGLALDAAGNVLLVGFVYGTFATTPGAFQTETGAGFIAKLGPDGSLVYASMISASPTAIAVDGAGSAYVTGSASSDFRTTLGVLKTGYRRSGLR